MHDYFEKKRTYNQITFRYSKGKSLLDGVEIHPHHEIVYYIDGEAVFMGEEFQEKLSRGTLLLIPKETYHRFRFWNPDTYTRLVLYFPDTADIAGILPFAMPHLKIFKNVNSHILHILNRMSYFLCSDKSEEELSAFLYGAFLMLLSEISIEEKGAVSPRLRESDHLISRCIQYIDTHLAGDLSIETVAREMNVSISSLFHCFKEELGISLHKYIIEKRLIYARKRITENENPSKIYLQCGYNDYSSFYKAYLKMFGHSPVKDKK